MDELSRALDGLSLGTKHERLGLRPAPKLNVCLGSAGP